MVFEMQQKVLFKYCDPAGIVFFPRYFEMMNDCVETFFAEALGWPFEEILAEGGIPTASISTDFHAPSRHGEMLVLSLAVTRIGRTSLAYRMRATCEGELRFESAATLVHLGPTKRPAPWPDGIRTTLDSYMEGST